MEAESTDTAATNTSSAAASRVAAPPKKKAATLKKFEVTESFDDIAKKISESNSDESADTLSSLAAASSPTDAQLAARKEEVSSLPQVVRRGSQRSGSIRFVKKPSDIREMFNRNAFVPMSPMNNFKPSAIKAAAAAAAANANASSAAPAQTPAATTTNETSAATAAAAAAAAAADVEADKKESSEAPAESTVASMTKKLGLIRGGVGMMLPGLATGGFTKFGVPKHSAAAASSSSLSSTSSAAIPSVAASDEPASNEPSNMERAAKFKKVDEEEVARKEKEKQEKEERAAEMRAKIDALNAVGVVPQVAAVAEPMVESTSTDSSASAQSEAVEEKAAETHASEQSKTDDDHAMSRAALKAKLNAIPLPFGAKMVLPRPASTAAVTAESEEAKASEEPVKAVDEPVTDASSSGDSQAASDDSAKPVSEPEVETVVATAVVEAEAAASSSEASEVTKADAPVAAEVEKKEDQVESPQPAVQEEAPVIQTAAPIKKLAEDWAVDYATVFHAGFINVQDEHKSSMFSFKKGYQTRYAILYGNSISIFENSKSEHPMEMLPLQKATVRLDQYKSDRTLVEVNVAMGSNIRCLRFFNGISDDDVAVRETGNQVWLACILNRLRESEYIARCNSSKEEVNQRLVEFFRQAPIQSNGGTLDLSDKALNEAAFALLCLVLQQTGHLARCVVHLNLANTNLQEKHLQKIAETLQHSVSTFPLATLDLSYNAFRPKVIIKFLESIEAHVSLRSLKLNGVFSQESDLADMTPTLLKLCTKKIHVDNVAKAQAQLMSAHANKKKEDEPEIETKLAENLQKNKGNNELMVLELSSNHISEKAMKEFCKTVRTKLTEPHKHSIITCSLLSLELEKNLIADEGGFALAELIKLPQLRSLNRLSLLGNSLEDNGVNVLVMAMASHPSLNDLDLSLNCVSEEKLAELAKSLDL